MKIHLFPKLIPELRNVNLKQLSDTGFYKTCLRPPKHNVVGIDIPLLITNDGDGLEINIKQCQELKGISRNKKVAILLGQDPLRKNNGRGIICPYLCRIFNSPLSLPITIVGTPYAIATSTFQSLPYPRSKRYYELTNKLLENNYDVYMTDVSKYYPSNSSLSNDKLELLKKEIATLCEAYGQNVSIILSGNRAQRIGEYIKGESKLSQCKQIAVPHISARQGAMKKWQSLLSSKVSSEKIIEYIITLIEENER